MHREKKMTNTTTFISDNDKQQQLAEYQIDVCCFSCVTVRLAASCCVVDLITPYVVISNFESIISAKKQYMSSESANRSSKWDVYNCFDAF